MNLSRYLMALVTMDLFRTFESSFSFKRPNCRLSISDKSCSSKVDSVSCSDDDVDVDEGVAVAVVVVVVVVAVVALGAAVVVGVAGTAATAGLTAAVPLDIVEMAEKEAILLEITDHWRRHRKSTVHCNGL